MDRFTQYAVVAARQAVEDANLTINDDNANRIGVWIGSGIGGMETFEVAHTILKNKDQEELVLSLFQCLFLTWLLAKFQLI